MCGGVLITYMLAHESRCTNFAKHDTLEILEGTETEGIEISAALGHVCFCA